MSTVRLHATEHVTQFVTAVTSVYCSKPYVWTCKLNVSNKNSNPEESLKTDARKRSVKIKVLENIRDECTTSAQLFYNLQEIRVVRIIGHKGRIEIIFAVIKPSVQSRGQNRASNAMTNCRDTVVQTNLMLMSILNSTGKYAMTSIVFK